MTQPGLNCDGIVTVLVLWVLQLYCWLLLTGGSWYESNMIGWFKIGLFSHTPNYIMMTALLQIGLGWRHVMTVLYCSGVIVLC